MIERKGNGSVLSILYWGGVVVGGCLCGRYLLVRISSALAGPFLILFFFFFALPNTSTPATHSANVQWPVLVHLSPVVGVVVWASADFLLFSLWYIFLSSSFHRIAVFHPFPVLLQRNKSKASKAKAAPCFRRHFLFLRRLAAFSRRLFVFVFFFVFLYLCY